jgi:hypothetical protein
MFNRWNSQTFLIKICILKGEKKMKMEDYIKRESDAQFILKDLINKKYFTITDCTIKDNYKHLCIDFGDGETRYTSLDTLLLVIIEFYGKDYLNDLIAKIVPYNLIKDKQFD